MGVKLQKELHQQRLEPQKELHQQRVKLQKELHQQRVKLQKELNQQRVKLQKDRHPHFLQPDQTDCYLRGREDQEDPCFKDLFIIRRKIEINCEFGKKKK